MVQLNMSKSQQMKNNKMKNKNKNKNTKIIIQKDSIYLLYQLVEELKG